MAAAQRSNNVAAETEKRRWPPGLREGDESDSEAGHPPFPCFPL